MSKVSPQQFIEIAKQIAKTSNCVSMKVGAVLVLNNRILSHGYNGTPAGYINCSQLFSERCKEHSLWSVDHEIHAEMNTIFYAAAEGLPIRGGWMFCTHEPCKNCVKHMIAAQLAGCVFEESYYNESFEDKKIKSEFAISSKFQICQIVNGVTTEWYPQNNQQ